MKHTVENFYGFNHPASIAVYLNEKIQDGPHVIETEESLFDSIERSFLFFNPDQNIYKLPSVDPWFPSKILTTSKIEVALSCSNAAFSRYFSLLKKKLESKNYSS